ncbi:MAG: YdeI/OmpD-associated family protein [Chitinophagales bacterium]
MPIKYTTTILKFDEQGEKTGWTYFVIPAELAGKLNPGVKKSYRVKGKLDEQAIKGIAIIPMGGGDFIMPLNADLRKKIGKRKGAQLNVQLAVDAAPFAMNADFIACLQDEPKALEKFEQLPGSHQRYFSKWIDSAKTDATKAKRIAMAVNAIAKSWGFAEMLRAQRKD